MSFIKTGLVWSAVLVVGLALIVMAWPEKVYTPYQPTSDYLIQVDKYHVPAMPDSWQYSSFSASDGTRLRWGQTAPRAEDKASVVIIPGYTGTLEIYGDHIAMLQARGYHVMGYDIRGQGGSQRHRADQPEKLYVQDFSIYGNDLAEFLAHVPTVNPRVLFGISFGGAVVTRSFGDHEIAADGALLIAPAYDIYTSPFSREQVKILGYLARWLGKSKHYMVGESAWRPHSSDLTQSSDCSANPERYHLGDVMYTRQPQLRVGGATNSWLMALIGNGELITSEAYTSRLKKPMTIIVPEHDKIVNSASTIQACKRDFKDCKLIELADTGHCLTLEHDHILNAIWDELDTLLLRIIS